jgi:hypothetical protein
MMSFEDKNVYTIISLNTGWCANKTTKDTTNYILLSNANTRKLTSKKAETHNISNEYIKSPQKNRHPL